MPSYFPYGICSWSYIVENKNFYIDNTQAIQNMEETGNFLKLWRPRRFGKTFFCSQLEHYYDVLKSGDEKVRFIK